MSADAQHHSRRAVRAVERFVTFAGVVGLFGAWQWLIVQHRPVSALVLAAVAGLVVGTRPYLERRTRRTVAD